MNKKFYWLKLKEDFFEEEAIEWVEEQENGKEYVLFYLKLCLKAMNTEGILIRRVGDMLIPYDAKKLADMTHTSIDTVRSAMTILEAVKLIETLQNGEIYIAQIASMIGSETDKAALMRKSREKKKIETANSSDSNNEVTMLPDKSNSESKNVTTEKEKEKDTEIDKEKKKKEKTAVADADEVDDLDNIKAKKTNLDKIIDDYTDNPKLREALQDFIKMRKAIKSILTDRALKCICSKLDGFSDNDEIKIKILENSIENAWKSVYDLKGGCNNADNSRLVKTDTSGAGSTRKDYNITDGLI